MLKTEIWKIEPSDFLLIRTPLKPIDFLPQFAPTDTSDGEPLAGRLKVLADCLEDLETRVAISHASSSLGARTNLLRPDDVSKENLKLAIALYKYVMRMSRRSTPFGLMAAVSVVDVAETTKIKVDPTVSVHARLDNAYTARIAARVRTELLSSRNRDFTVEANNTSHALSSEVRRVQRVGDGQRYRFGVVKRTEAIDLILRLAERGARSGALIDKMKKDLACSEDEAWNFLQSLVNRDLLYTQAELVLTSGDCFGELCKSVLAISGMEKLADQLIVLQRKIDHLTYVDESFEQKIAEVVSSIAQLLGDDPSSISNPVHLDTYRPSSDSSFSRGELADISRIIQLLLGVLWKSHEPLEEFTRAFIRRYGDAEVPLLEALDADTGVRFGPPRAVASPLLDGAVAPSVSPTVELEWDLWRQHLLERILAAAASGKDEIGIGLDELARYGRKPRPADSAQSVAVHLSAVESGNDGASRALHLRGIYGPSAANLLGRFTCGDPILATKVRKLADLEQLQVAGRLAEVVHLPAGRTANVLARECIRDTEIVYGPVRASGSDRLIGEDLHLSARGGRLRLRSKSTGEEVLPRLASAHFTGAHNLPVYQFLAALQHAGGRVAPFLDSKIFDRLPHIPRIRVESLVVSPARWRIDRNESGELAKSSGVAEQLESVRLLRARHGLPRWVVLAQGDNLLDIDLEDPLSALAFVSEVKGKNAILQESLVADVLHSTGPDALLSTSELIIPMHVSCDVEKNPREVILDSPLSIQELRRLKEKPMERWIYLEIFTGESSAERILADIVAPRVNDLREAGRLEKWFYVRYYEAGDFHLRLRFLPGDGVDRFELTDYLLDIFAGWENDGIVHDVRVRGYEPELERYGGEACMPLCEELFYLHSELALRVLRGMLGASDQEDRRWLAVATLVWQTLSCVFPETDDLARFASAMVQAYRKEMPASTQTAKAISGNYRKHRALLDEALDGRRSDPAFQIFSNSQLQSRRHDLLSELASCHTGSRLAGIVSSLVHMDCNRLFPFSARGNEMMIYEYLARYARSKSARHRGSAGVAA